jgi:hypothetical protein
METDAANAAGVSGTLCWELTPVHGAPWNPEWAFAFDMDGGAATLEQLSRMCFKASCRLA